MSQSRGVRRSSQKAALPLEGWDIALQLDEDPRIGNGLIECLEYESGERVLFLLDVEAPGMEGAVIAARLRGFLYAHGILRPGALALVESALSEVVAFGADPGAIRILAAEVVPGSARVRVVHYRARSAFLLREALREGKQDETSAGENRSWKELVKDEAFKVCVLCPDPRIRGPQMTDVVVGHRECLILVSGFTVKEAGEDRPHLLSLEGFAPLVAGARGKGAATAIDGVMNLGVEVRSSLGAEWAEILLSTVWMRRSAIAS